MCNKFHENTCMCSDVFQLHSHTENRLAYKVSAAYRISPGERVIQLIKVRAVEIRDCVVCRRVLTASIKSLPCFSDRIQRADPWQKRTVRSRTLLNEVLEVVYFAEASGFQGFESCGSILREVNAVGYSSKTFHCTVEKVVCKCSEKREKYSRPFLKLSRLSSCKLI
jgi:hypothetical protein